MFVTKVPIKISQLAQFVLVFEPNQRSYGENTLSTQEVSLHIPRPVPNEMDEICGHHGSELLFHPQWYCDKLSPQAIFIKHFIDGARASDMICIT